MTIKEKKVYIEYTKKLWNANSSSEITELLIRFNEAMKEPNAINQLTDFNNWVEENHNSFKIPDMILQQYIKHLL